MPGFDDSGTLYHGIVRGIEKSAVARMMTEQIGKMSCLATPLRK